MQRLHIIHRTYYHFSQSVNLGRHCLRLYPRTSHALQVESFAVTITPFVDLRWQRDAEDNSIAIAEFSTFSQNISIESDVIVKQYSDSIWNIDFEAMCGKYPVLYSTDEGNELDHYRVLPPAEALIPINHWIQHFWDDSEIIRIDLLILRLCRAIYENFSYVIREEAGVQSAAETILLQRGSCRDFSLLLIEAARCLGFAARFISGYLMTPPNSQNYGATHAWVEIYFPGLGWVGYDPTVGGFTNSDNIPVAVSAIPDSIPPVEGVYSGIANSVLDVGVWVKPL